MNQLASYKQVSAYAANRRDPTRTTSLRNTFSREAKRRFRNLRKLINQAIIDNDVFGLTDSQIRVRINQVPSPRRFAFRQSSQKISAFMDWLRREVQDGVLDVTDISQVGTGINAAWTNKYIHRAYGQGVKRSRVQMLQAGVSVPTLELTGGIAVAMSTPIHADRVGLLYTRAFTDLKGITDAMDSQISRVLAEGLSQGDGPRKIAEKLTAVIKQNESTLAIQDTLGRFVTSERRAEMLARTEIIRAHAEGQLQEFENWGVSGVSGRAELVTAGYRVCPQCEALEGNVYSINDARGIIPVHVNCYDRETEVYTNEGWKPFPEVKGNEKFWSISPETLVPEWVDAVRKIDQHHNGKVLSFTNNTTDLMVTPDHNMFCFKRKNKAQKWDFVQAKDLPKADVYFYRGVEWVGEDREFFEINGLQIDIITFCKFMAYYLADGSTTKRSENQYQIKIAQETHIDLMYKELCSLPVKVNKGEKAIYISDKRLSTYTHQFGKCNEKYIPDFIKTLSPRLIKVFLKAYAITDGHTRKGKTWKGYKFNDSYVFHTTSKRIAGDLGELIMKVGGRPSFDIKEVAGTKHEFSNGVYNINFDAINIYWLRYVKTSIDSMEIKEIDYNDRVYCVELEKNHTLLVRRNGKIIWSGNCRCAWLPVIDI